MLKIFYGEPTADNYIFNPDAFFNNTYEDSWITEPLSVQMIKDIDGSDVIGPRVIDSPFLGSIPTERLSGGVKTLILMSKDQSHIFNASACGDNCAKWIYEISKHKDLTIDLHHVMDFSDCEGFSAYIVNTDKQVGSYKEYLDEALRIEER